MLGKITQHLMDITLVDVVSQVQWLGETSLVTGPPRRKGTHLISEKENVEDALKRVNSKLVEERFVWESNHQEKDRIIAHAQHVQEELERKAVQERLRLMTHELEDKEANFQKASHECDKLVGDLVRSQRELAINQSRLPEVEGALSLANVEVEDLTNHLARLHGDRNWLISQGLVGAFEYLRQSTRYGVLLDNLCVAAWETGRLDGIHEAYHNCKQTRKTNR
ncbi:hypothetical protein Hanom_Chr12g01092321 [Helianthus anomalus]